MIFDFTEKKLLGQSVIQLPQAQKMLTDIRSGHISALVFSKLARLARNTRELLEFSDEFQRHKADLVSLQESIDTSTPAGRMFFTVIAAMAQWEREEISERVAASVPIRAKLGKSTGGQAMFGYQWLDGKLVPHPDEAPIRKLIYELFLEIRTRQGVARALNEKGYRTRNGGDFTCTSVDRWLRDPTAKGVRVANYAKSRGQGLGWDLKDEADWVLVPVEAIVPEELWDDCNRLLDQRGSKRAKRRRKAVYLFSGYVYCGRCGGNQKLYPQTNWDKYRCMKCANKIPKDDLEEIFHQHLSAFFVSNVSLGALLEKIDGRISEIGRLLKANQRDLESVQKRIDACIELFQAGAIGSSEVREQVAPLEERKEQIRTERPNLEAELKSLKRHKASEKDIRAEGQTLAERWPKLEKRDKRAVIEAILERITVHPDELEFEFNYVPGSLLKPLK